LQHNHTHYSLSPPMLITVKHLGLLSRFRQTLTGQGYGTFTPKSGGMGTLFSPK